MNYNDLLNFLDFFTTSNLVIAISVASIGLIFGPKQYFKQKLIKDIDDVYIKKGLEELKLFLHQQRSVCDHNYTVAIDIFKYLRDLPYEKFLKQLEKIKNNFDQVIISSVVPKSFYSLITVCGENKQLVSIFIDSIFEAQFLNQFFKNELLIDFDYVILNKENFISAKSNVDSMLKKVSERYNSQKYKNHHSAIIFLETMINLFRNLQVGDYKNLFLVKENSKIKLEVSWFISNSKKD